MKNWEFHKAKVGSTNSVPQQEGFVSALSLREAQSAKGYSAWYLNSGDIVSLRDSIIDSQSLTRLPLLADFFYCIIIVKIRGSKLNIYGNESCRTFFILN